MSAGWISRRLVFTLVVSMLVTAASAVFYSTSAASVYRSTCGVCYNSGTGEAHAFGYILYPYDNFEADCEAFNSCHGNSQSGTCQDFHWACGTGGELATRVRRAAEKNDVAFIRATLRQYPKQVASSARTGEVTITECDGSTIRIAVPRQILAEAT